MATYACLFFKDGIVAYWENIEETEERLRASLQVRLLEESWQLIEVWRGEAVVFRISG